MVKKKQKYSTPKLKGRIMVANNQEEWIYTYK